MMAKIHSELPEQEVADRYLFGGLLALLVFAPLPLGSNRYWAHGLLLLFALMMLLGLAWAWRHKLSSALRRLQGYAWPISLLACVVLWSWLQNLPLPAVWVQFLSPMAAAAQGQAVQMTLSLDNFQSRDMASLAFSYFSVFLVAVLTVRDAGRLDKMAQVLVWSGVLQAVLGAALFSAHAEYRLFYANVSHLRMIGSFVYHNSLAGYLCMCLSIGIGLMLARLGEKSPKHNHWKARVVVAVSFMLGPKMRLRMLLIVMVIALVLTRSRMGNSAFFISMLAVGLLVLAVARKNAPHTLVLIASLIIVDVVVVGSWVGLEKVVERIDQTELTVADGGESESVQARTEAARIALPMVRDYPLAGTGGGSFYNTFLPYRTPTFGNYYFDHAHNDFVEIAADYGLVGLCLFGSLAALTLAVSIQTLARRRSRLPWGISFGVTMAIVALLLHSTVDFNLQIPSNALTIVVILAMGWIASKPSIRSST